MPELVTIGNIWVGPQLIKRIRGKVLCQSMRPKVYQDINSLNKIEDFEDKEEPSGSMNFMADSLTEMYFENTAENHRVKNIAKRKTM